jgi:hypothetical protein
VTLNPNLPPGEISSSPVGAGLRPNQPDHEVSRVESVPQPVLLQGWRLWAHRLGILLFVVFCAVLGMLLVILPWRPDWTDNHLLFGAPALRAVLASGFARGLCTGLGLLDIWIGFREAIHYSELRPPSNSNS